MSRRIFGKVLLTVLAGFVLLVFSGILSAQGRSEQAFERVREVQERHTTHLMSVKGVEGTAVGLDDSNNLAVKVFLERPGVAGIPKRIDGVPTHIVVTGKFYAVPKPPGTPGKGPPKKEDKVDPTSRLERPVPIGVSTGNVDECSAGTIGCRVKDGSFVYALSNNHVYALENNAEENSEVVQPGLYDTDCACDPANVIGTLADFEPINFDGSANYVDAAIAVTTTDQLANSTPPDGYGTPESQTVGASLNQKVQKYGRTTALTRGIITGLNAILFVTYDSGTALFADQIVVQSRKPFIKAGDSGSLLVTQGGNNPVGLLFAGSVDGKYAVANHIEVVLSTLDVQIDGQ